LFSFHWHIPIYCSVEKKVAGASTITCDGGKKILKLHYINDDYCDCDDGSDEPGTAACAGRNAVFYCKNAGHIAVSIPTGWVDDGHCGMLLILLIILITIQA